MLQTNTFQAVLVTDGEMSFVVLNYVNLTWTAGITSNGNSQTGLGGTPAVVNIGIEVVTVSSSTMFYFMVCR